MPNKPASQQQLLAENADLRVRLAQAESTLREVRSGEVDALVVSDAGGAQLFAPANADQSFRILVGEMSEGALTMTAEGVIVYANRRLAGMLKAPLEKVIGSTVRTWIAPDSQPMLQSLLEHGADEARHGELVLATSDGTGLPVYLSVSNLHIEGRPDAYCLVAFDLTEHNRVEAIAASERVARELLAAANQSRGEMLRVIEDKTRAEEALRLAEQQQRQLAENLEIERTRLLAAQRIAKIGSWETNLATMSVHWSDELHRILETDPATFNPTHRTFLDFVHPEDRARVDEGFASSLAGGAANAIEHRFLLPDKRIKVVEERWQVIFDTQGVPTRAIGTCQDITERRRLEAALRESEARFRSLTEMSSDFYWESDAEHRLSVRGSGNTKVSTVSTFQRGAHIGERRWEIPHLSPDAAGWQAHQAVLDAHLPFRQFELSRLGADDTERYISISGDPVFNASGAFLGYRGVGTDITETKRAAEALQTSLEEFHTLAEAMPQIVWITRADGWNIYFNQQWMDYTGLTLEESLGHGWNKPFHPDDQQRAWDAWQQATKTIGMYSIEARLRRADGAYRWWLVRGLPVKGANGEILKWFGTCTDIHELKMAELEIARYVGQLQIAVMSTVQVATTLSEMRDPYTAGHERRVAEIAAAIGAELGLDARRQEGLRIAGHLHDVGKITIPSEILSKPGKISAVEYQLIQGHAQAGYDVLKDVEFPWPVAEVALQHHERMDGSGYPQGLKGEAILLEARIMAVADTVEAMSSHRPYRPGLGIEAALAEIKQGRGTAYDTAVADACLKLFQEKAYVIPA